MTIDYDASQMSFEELRYFILRDNANLMHEEVRESVMSVAEMLRTSLRQMHGSRVFLTYHHGASE